MHALLNNWHKLLDPIYYRNESKKESVAYIILSFCSVSRAVHLQLTENLTSALICNLPRAPWWRGQFERLIGLTKQVLDKSLENTKLNWNELEEVLLDIEVNIDNYPLKAISMILGRVTTVLEKNPKDEDESD